MLKFKNMVAECVRKKTFILVKIRFPSTGEAEYVNDSFISNNLLQRYTIEGHLGSILSPENILDYVIRTKRVTTFTGALVDYDIHVDCVLQLRVLQQIPEHKLCRFNGKRMTGVILTHASLDDGGYWEQMRVKTNSARFNDFSRLCDEGLVNEVVGWHYLIWLEYSG